ncbi:hypothetical protein [Treponema zioleckii]|uniref:hypothetical protein n=1 Tax=Treponema zioleckii TaxID=331680 RepID=UPI00168AD002|nr:hypothetical protein [Treponema zioleckii]
MAGKSLTGIERALVLEYLSKTDLPLSLSLFNGTDSKNKPFAGMFPVVVKAENIQMIKSDVILIRNPSVSILRFVGKNVKVQFYYNRVGLFFLTTLETSSLGVEVFVPPVISHIEEDIIARKKDFSLVILGDSKSKNAVAKNVSLGIECFCEPEYAIFKTPAFSEVDEKIKLDVKAYLEKLVSIVKACGRSQSIGDGAFLISIARYFSDSAESQKITSLQDRFIPPAVIYLDSSRIVFVCKKKYLFFSSGAVFSVLMNFPIKGPLKERKVFADLRIEDVFISDNNEKCAVNAVFSSIKQEDLRFISEIPEHPKI